MSFNLQALVDAELAKKDAEIAWMKQFVMPWNYMTKASDRNILVNDIFVTPWSTRPEPILIAPGATKAHVKLTMTAKIDRTTYVEVNKTTGGSVGFVGNYDIGTPKNYQYWRPGDDADLWVTIDILQPRSNPGDRFKCSVNGPGIAGPVAWFFEVAEGAVNARPLVQPYHRPPYTLNLAASPTQRQDMAAIEWSDSGFNSTGQPCWVSRLSHGYSQTTMNGLFTSEEKFPGVAISPLTKEIDSAGRPFVRLHAAKFPEPVTYNGKTFPFQGATLSGHTMPQWHHRNGLYRMEMQFPSRHGCWSASWLSGLRLSDLLPLWPPEIDMAEHFNGAYGAAYTQYTTSSAQHSGKFGTGSRAVVSGSGSLEINRLGIFDDSFSFYDAPHWTDVVIGDEYVTHFVDGVETHQHLHILHHPGGSEDWGFYPMAQNGVQENASSAFDQGTPDVLWYGMEYYAPDSGYVIA